MRLLTSIALGTLLTMSPFLASAETIVLPEFVVDLPEGWERIPEDVMKLFKQNLAQIAPDANPKDYEYSYGFQGPGATNWMEYPYVLVQFKNQTGRLTPSQLRASTTANLSNVISEKKKLLGPVFSKFDIGQPYYDSEHNMVWLKTLSTNAYNGNVATLSAIVPSNKGLIGFHGYAPAGDTSGLFGVYQNIFTSVETQGVYRYEQRWNDHLPSWLTNIDWSAVIGKALGGGLTVLFIAFVLMVSKLFRRKSD